MVEIDQLPNILYFSYFYKVDPVFVFIKSIKIGSFSRFGYPEIRKNRDPCGGKVSYQLTAGAGPGAWRRWMRGRCNQSKLSGEQCLHAT